MKMLQLQLAFALLMLAACMPIGCQYLSVHGPEWVSQPIPGDTGGGSLFISTMLLILLLGSSGAVLIYSYMSKK